MCQLCNMVGHGASACSKLFNCPKCNKCEGGHRIENCGLKCSYCFGLGHTEECCWKKNGRGFIAFANYLEVLVNDEEATLAKLNQLCGANNNIFSRTKVPRHRILVIAPEIDRNRKVVEEGMATQGKFGNDMITANSKILTHFFKCKISLSLFETILIIPGELEYLEGLVKLAKRRKDEKTQQVTHISLVDAIPAIKKVCVNKNHKSKTLQLTMEVQNGLI